MDIERAQRMLRDAKRSKYTLEDYIWLMDELFQELDCQPRQLVKDFPCQECGGEVWHRMDCQQTNKMTVVEQAEYALRDDGNFELRCALERAVIALTRPSFAMRPVDPGRGFKTGEGSRNQRGKRDGRPTGTGR